MYNDNLITFTTCSNPRRVTAFDTPIVTKSSSLRPPLSIRLHYGKRSRLRDNSIYLIILSSL